MANQVERFESAVRDLPDGVEHDPLSMKTLADLQWACRLQLDLCEEGEDSAEGIDPRPIRKWLRLYGDPTRNAN